MTTTDGEQVDRSDWYVQVTAPGVPYSAIRVAFNREAVADAVLMCKYLAQEWHKAFDAAPAGAVAGYDSLGQPIVHATRVEPEEPHYEPFLGDERDARPVASGDAVAYCPDHGNAPCKFSAPQYNKDGDRLYHALSPADQYMKDGKKVQNHSLYWRQTVDANGESNNGKVIPQLVGASR